MRIVVTGSAGRVGRAIFSTLAETHSVIGLDRIPDATTHFVGDVADEHMLKSAFDGADAVIHAAALHAPHVGVESDAEFQRINVQGTRLVAKAALSAGVGRLVFTSTTALYGHAVSPGACIWIDEETPPQPRTIYHRTKLEAEHVLEDAACVGMAVRVLRMSRCFPESADVMAAYRLHRGIDLRDVAAAHAAALTDTGPAFGRYIISAATPFQSLDCADLARDAGAVIRLRAPGLAKSFDQRGWRLPQSVDRVYSPAKAMRELGWTPKFGFEAVVRDLDLGAQETLPVTASGE